MSINHVRIVLLCRDVDALTVRDVLNRETSMKWDVSVSVGWREVTVRLDIDGHVPLEESADAVIKTIYSVLNDAGARRSALDVVSIHAVRGDR